MKKKKDWRLTKYSPGEVSHSLLLSLKQFSQGSIHKLWPPVTVTLLSKYVTRQ
uniref:Uncharacterized protein n=1 Tax=Anguilla anguilla TaxID=7936 RepID=A0A0E9WG99_ANGAN